ncbi:MAG: hypothetical protein GY814_16135 [Gammaproteobacteria bacterium]|nr:hypothetical protein [Gammaproteobacteria bacterium]
MTPCSDAYFASPLALRTPGKQCGLTATGVYQPSLRSPWLEARAKTDGYIAFNARTAHKKVLTSWPTRNHN